MLGQRIWLYNFVVIIRDGLIARLTKPKIVCLIVAIVHVFSHLFSTNRAFCVQRAVNFCFSICLIIVTLFIETLSLYANFC